MRSISFLVLAALIGCGGASDPEQPPPTNPNLLSGFNPTAPAKGEIQVMTPILRDIGPGKDVTYCSYLDFVADKTMAVTTYLGFQSSGGHHTILYAVPKILQKPNTHECTETDMLNVKYIGGGGTDGTISASEIPPGLAFSIPQGAGLMLVSHWINATGHAIDGQAAYNIAVQDPTPDLQTADLFTTVATDFKLPVGKGQVHTECKLMQDLQFFVLGGHAHEWATHVTINRMPAGGGPGTLLYDTKWSKDLVFDTPLNSYTKEAPLTVHAGDSLSVDCLYDNTTTSEIAFPKEMCVGFGYFFPATAEIDCVDGSWPN